MRAAAVTIQRYVRGYLATIWKDIALRKFWRKAEQVLGAAIVLQCRWRIFMAKRRIRLVLRTKWRLENAALAIQRNWYVGHPLPKAAPSASLP